MAGATRLLKKSLLTDPASVTELPSLGFASCGGAMILDMNTTVGVRYQLAIYMVGSAGDLSIQASRILDLRTVNPIAKSVAIKNYGAGTWPPDPRAASPG